MSVAPTNIQYPANWIGLTSHLGAGDGYGIEYYAFGSGLAPGSTLTGFKFVSNESPSQLMGDISVPGVGNLPATTTFLYNGGAFSANVAQVTATVVPEPSTIVLGSLGSLALWFAWRRSAQVGLVGRAPLRCAYEQPRQPIHGPRPGQGARALRAPRRPAARP